MSFALNRPQVASEAEAEVVPAYKFLSNVTRILFAFIIFPVSLTVAEKGHKLPSKLPLAPRKCP